MHCRRSPDCAAAGMCGFSDCCPQIKKTPAAEWKAQPIKGRVRGNLSARSTADGDFICWCAGGGRLHFLNECRRDTPRVDAFIYVLFFFPPRVCGAKNDAIQSSLHINSFLFFAPKWACHRLTGLRRGHVHFPFFPLVGSSQQADDIYSSSVWMFKYFAEYFYFGWFFCHDISEGGANFLLHDINRSV